MKYGISLLAVAALMLALAAPTFGASFASVKDGAWGSYEDNYDGTWGTGAGPGESDQTTITHNVTIGAADGTESQDDVIINSGGSLTKTGGKNALKVNQNLLIGVGSTGTVDLSGSGVTAVIKLYGSGDDGHTVGANGLLKVGGSSTFGIGYDLLNEGAATLTIASGGILEMIGSNAQVIGDGVFDTKTYGGSLLGTGTVKFTADAAGVSSVDTYIANADTLNLVVDLTTFTGLGDLTLMEIGTGVQGEFTSVTVNGLGTRTYTLDYEAGTGGNDVVLSVVPEPATMSLLAIGGLALLRRKRRRA